MVDDDKAPSVGYRTCQCIERAAFDTSSLLVLHVSLLRIRLVELQLCSGLVTSGAPTSG